MSEKRLIGEWFNVKILLSEWFTCECKATTKEHCEAFTDKVWSGCKKVIKKENVKQVKE
jgi:hypothetical protein